jgi:DNA polymerase-3 subunit alpha
LIRCGACDVFGERALVLASSERARQRADRARRDRESGQTSLFGLVEEIVEGPSDAGLRVPPMGAEEKLQNEKELLGLYLSDHPLNRLQARLSELTDAQAIDITTELVGREVRVAGLVREVRRVVTRRGQIMAYAQVEDLTGVMELTLFPSIYEQYLRVLEPDRIVVVQGKVEPARGGGPRNRPEEEVPDPDQLEEAERAALLPDFVWAWDDPECVPVDREFEVHVDLPEVEPALLDRVCAEISSHPGPAPVLLHFTVENGSVTVQAGERFRVEPGPALQAALDELLGGPVTRFETVRPRAAPAAANGNGNGGRRNGRREMAAAR